MSIGAFWNPRANMRRFSAGRWFVVVGLLLPGCDSGVRDDGKLEWSLTIETKKAGVGPTGARTWEVVSNVVISGPTNDKISEEVAKLDWNNAAVINRVTIGYRQHHLLNPNENSDTAVFIEGTLGGVNEFGPLRAYWNDQQPDMLHRYATGSLSSVDEAIAILIKVKAVDESWKTSLPWTDLDAGPAITPPAAGNAAPAAN